MYRKTHFLFVLLFLSLQNHSFGQSGASELVDRGKQLNYEGYYDSAAGVLRKAMLLADGDPELTIKIQYEIGDSFLNLGKCDSATLVIRKGIELVSNNDSLLADGYRLLSRSIGGCSREWKEAIDLLHRSIMIKEQLFEKNSIELSYDYTLMGYLNHYYRRNDSAFYYLRKALDIQKEKGTPDPDDLATTYFYLSNAYERVGDLKSAIEYGQLSLTIRREHLRPHHPSTSNVISFLGRIYKTLGNYDLALKYLMEGLETRKISLGPTHGNVAASYYEIGTLYGNTFNYKRAEYFIEQGNLIIEERYGDRLPVLYTYYAYLGKMCYKSGDAKKGKELLDKAEELGEKHLPKDHPYLAIIYNSLGDYYADLNFLDAQKKYHNLALSIYEIRNPRAVAKADILLKLGLASSKLADYEQSEKYYAEAYAIFTKKLGSLNPKISSIHQYQGNLKKTLGDAEGAMDQYWKSIEALSYDQINKDLGFDLNVLTHKQLALNSLHNMGSIVKTMDTQNPQAGLERSLQFYRKAVELVDLIASEYRLEDERSQLAQDTRTVFNGAIATVYDLYVLTKDEAYKELMFRFVEKSKSPVLLSRMLENEAKKFSNVPEELLAEERNIRIELSYFKDKLRDARASNDKEKIRQYQTLVFDTRTTYESFKEDLKIRFSDYYAYQYENDVIGIAEIRQSLEPTTAVLEYYESAASIYAFQIDKDGSQVFKIPVTDQLSSALIDYHKSLTDNVFIVDEPKKADSTFATTSNFLFEQLISPLLKNESDFLRIQIVPDGKLSSMNFGTTLTELPSLIDLKYEELKYLFLDFNISYAYSSTLSAKSEAQNLGNSFAGFAPSYSAMLYEDVDSSKHPMTYELVRNGKLPLPGAIAEVKEIKNLFSGKIWLEEEASESNFKENVGKYSIIHLAMHSLLNDMDPEYSELLFNTESDTINDGYLTIDEIYNLDLNASMVVLSACSSGGGTLQVGEGPISFTRAFSYAGCPSVIMSLWKLPDASTNEIMVEFYQNIKAGDDKDVALKKAQIAYIENTDDPLYKHPFFWGSFVVLGDVQPVSSSGLMTKLIYAGISLLLIGGILFARKKFA